MITLAKRLGAPVHHSLLLRKAGWLGLDGAPAMIGLAVARGCLHYQGGPEPVPGSLPSHTAFSDEELAIARLSPSLTYHPRSIRVGAQMLGSRSNQPQRLALLARRERAEKVVRHVATAGQQTEPHEPFWQELLAALPTASALRATIPPGVLPHPSRFRSEAGLVPALISASGDKPAATWLRPSRLPTPAA